MPRKGQGQKAGKVMQGHATLTRPLANTLHSSTRTWGDLPANLMMMILGSLPGKHRKSRINMANMTVVDLWNLLKQALQVKSTQAIPTRDTFTLICEAIMLSHQIQGLKAPPA